MLRSVDSGSHQLKGVSADRWVSMVGKGALQDFQDCFVRDYRIPLLLVDTQGKPLLVPSLKLGFCNFAQSGMAHDCSGIAAQDVAEVVSYFESRRVFDPLLRTCNFGITSFAMPVFFNARLVALWRCDGLVFDDAPHAERLQAKFDLPVITHEELGNATSWLERTCRLLDVHLEPSAGSGGTARTLSPVLTPRENEIAVLVCDGLSNSQIAGRLFLSEKTVKTHMSSILAKLNVKNRVQLICECADTLDENPRQSMRG
ncbi:MAG: LuxR C-terminal-related transcriptional regulator [Coriobacteriaceae bacterium]|uniref:LuxR family transcriptional regulator n=1 Tax=Tractidigestivibacter sp. TaxID=2847320 RepID=UPI002A837440|nr:LuxR family transcriptional regulator [Tractidigestivibacter sp.]MCI6274830.1 LuxR C-terminal-related transcriptional regulator [Coriobacteriaceae bacterium]MCI6548299.1 LuxR C-terminal-related transcriptional regulator [Coriobacteriaceae bacterium]MCI6845426.1 LuxR C-terminal-related transcriptional regulator [Coriobacteriaceae bacterium]MCI7438541.1 LuxR C-terminal-related transcriptional regulator [Coriobacteriaceae bacterium]MDY4533928.1 LuxR family transcriptional regulator [Tractidige